MCHSGAIMILAGIYEFTPLKNACLRHCRSPLHLVMHGWREGYGGATRMGATHGLFCLGCCGGIMAVLFVVGLMNLGWMAALSLLILTEKLAPSGVAIGRLVGGLFIILGLLMALQPRLFPAGGMPELVGEMIPISNFLGVKQVPIEFHKDGLKRVAVSPGIADMAIEAYQGPDGGPVMLGNIVHPFAHDNTLTLGTATKGSLTDYTFAWDNTGKNAHYSPFEWSA
jgi:hypothetical protein